MFMHLRVIISQILSTYYNYYKKIFFKYKKQNIPHFLAKKGKKLEDTIDIVNIRGNLIREKVWNKHSFKKEEIIVLTSKKNRKIL